MAVGIITAGLLASACGGKATPGVARLSRTSTSLTTSSGSPTSGSNSTKGDALKFSQCMRSHGVTNFPDPGADGSIDVGGQELGNLGIDPNSPTYQAAQKSCQRLLPRAGPPPSQQQIQLREQRALEFARCMRSHGIPNFPDPKFNTSDGGLSIQISGPGSGIDLSSPRVQAAQKACSEYGPKSGAMREQPVG